MKSIMNEPIAVSETTKLGHISPYMPNGWGLDDHYNCVTGFVKTVLNGAHLVFREIY